MPSDNLVFLQAHSTAKKSAPNGIHISTTNPPRLPVLSLLFRQQLVQRRRGEAARQKRRETGLTLLS